MSIEFSNTNGNYVSVFKVEADFNLHIEMGGKVSVLQRGCASGDFDAVASLPSDKSSRTVFDYDFTAAVYPKWIKVITSANPSKAEVTSGGSVTVE